jgi:hypothetical protein
MTRAINDWTQTLDLSDDRQVLTFREEACIQLGDFVQVWFITPDILDALAQIGDD